MPGQDLIAGTAVHKVANCVQNFAHFFEKVKEYFFYVLASAALLVSRKASKGSYKTAVLFTSDSIPTHLFRAITILSAE